MRGKHVDTYLEIKWTVSRGYETYGYNICTLIDTSTGKRYRCMGGGYDMRGTVFGDWLADVHQDELTSGPLWDRAHAIYRKDAPGSDWTRETSFNADALYGMASHDEPSSIKADAARGFRRCSIILDGAAGFEAMRKIAEAIGLTIRWANLDRKGNARGIVVESA